MNAAAADRFERLDALRGAAIVWMAGFHFCFDLNQFRLLPPQNFYADPFWTVQRAAIVTLFLFCAGLGQAVALHAAQGWPRFWKRWLQVAGCAVLVSAGSALMFPQSWISFGVLHGIAVMLVLGRMLAALRGWLWPLGAVALGAAAVVGSPSLRHPLDQLGPALVTRLPATEDWVPLLPWLGVVLWGLEAGRLLLQHRRGALACGLPGPLRPLAVLGRWSLSVYMLHQPLLIGLLMGGRALRWW